MQSAHNRHSEIHKLDKSAWLRAAVMGANDGIVSTASLILGVAAANSGRSEILLSGVAGLVAGALSMAAGEYVSVSSQSDIEAADLKRETHELATSPAHEEEELAQIYVGRGLDLPLARQVAKALTEHDALKSHLRDELGIHELGLAKPVQAALTSALTFAMGAGLPLLVVLAVSREMLSLAVLSSSLLSLAILGFLAARTGGANYYRGAGRVLFWGALAMLTTALIGKIFGTVVG